jgi:RNA-directed DNA polymerase
MSLKDDKQRNIQMELDFPSALTGEAREAGREEPESSGATSGSENPASTNRLMEEVCERENLREALRQVKANKGSPGVDGMTVGGIKDYLKQHWPAIREQLLNGTYEPKPVRRVEIPKPDGGVRKLGIPTVLDRFIQQAVMQVLQRRWDRTFSDHSYGFRPRRSAHQAVAQAQQYIAEGHGWCVDLDLEKFFDRVSHDKLMGQIAKRVADKRLLKLIRAFLNAGVMENGLVSPSVEGTPQGGPLSPLLSNLVLDELDRELERRGHRFVRYADDCNIYVRSERAGQRVMESATQFITQKLKLKVNEAKSAVARP